MDNIILSIKQHIRVSINNADILVYLTKRSIAILDMLVIYIEI